MQYVVVYARPVDGTTNAEEVLLVLKNRPPWQAGRYNLPGGKIEEGETPEEAAIRELKEETGLESFLPNCVAVMGRIFGPWGVVYCVKVPVSPSAPIRPREGETEIFSWMQWHKVRNNKLLIPNLRVIIPLMMTGVVGWEIEDHGPTWKEKQHTISITVPSDDGGLIDGNDTNSSDGHGERSGDLQ